MTMRILALLFAVCVAVSAQSQPAPPNAKGQSKRTIPAQVQQVPASPVPLNVSVGPIVITTPPDTGEQKHEYGSEADWAMVTWTKIATIIAFTLAVIAWIQFRKQTKQTIQALGHAKDAVTEARNANAATERAIVIQNRPRAVVRHIVVKGIDSGELGKLREGYALVTNVGSLPITLTGFRAEWVSVKKLPIENPMLLKKTMLGEPINIDPIRFARLPLPDKDIDTLDHHRQFWHDDKEKSVPKELLHLIGVLKYKDAIGGRRVYFCFLYDSRANRFRKVPHPNYNYSD
jgi:hypothetical protein